MASTCPKCHQVVDSDTVCCADIQYSWKCKSCGKLTTGFVIPYGRCYLCGGEHELSQGYTGALPDQVAAVQEAMQYEINMYQFYRLAMKHTTDEQLRTVLEEMSLKEEDHIDELEQKYHVHLDDHLRSMPEDSGEILAQWIFRDIDFSNAKEHVLEIYDQAIEMEQRTRDRFKEHANSLPPGPQKEIYRELAAEEEDHITLLETERAQFSGQPRFRLNRIE